MFIVKFCLFAFFLVLFVRVFSLHLAKLKAHIKINVLERTKKNKQSLSFIDK